MKGIDYRNKLNGTAQDLANKLDELALVLFGGTYDPMGSDSKRVWTSSEIDPDVHPGSIATDIAAQTIDPELKEAVGVLLDGLPGGSEITGAFKTASKTIQDVLAKATELKEDLLGERAEALKALNDPRNKNAVALNDRFGQWKDDGKIDNTGDKTLTRGFGFIPALAAFAGADSSGLNAALQQLIDATASAEAYTILVAYGNALLGRLGEILPQS